MKFSTLFIVLVFCGSHVFAQPSYHWFSGWWMYYSINSDTVQGEHIKSELYVTDVTGNDYVAVQKIYSINDTLAQVKLNGSGYFTNGEIHYKKENETYRKEPAEAVIWNAYAQYKVDTVYFSIRDRKLILHIKVKPAQKDGVREFAYYRDLQLIPFSLRWQLQKRYGNPQLIDDTVAVVNGNDADSNTTFSNLLPPEVIARKNTLVKTLAVTSPDIQIILLDDAEIDGDIVSLYHNGAMVLNHKTLGKEVVKYVLTADEEHAHHEFILVAENLGSIPPNTALVRIRAGETKYEFVVHSDMHENVKFIINYVGDKKIDVVPPH